MQMVDHHLSDGLFDAADNAITELEAVTNWPLLGRDRSAVLANLLCARAWSMEASCLDDRDTLHSVITDYNRAIQMLAPFPPAQTLFTCHFSLTDVILRQQVTEKSPLIEASIERLVKPIRQSAEVGMWDHHTSLLSILGGCYCKRQEGDKRENKAAALSCFEKIHQIFEERGMEHQLAEVKVDMALCHAQFADVKDPDDLTVTLKVFEETTQQLGQLDASAVDLSEFAAAYSSLVSIQSFRSRDSSRSSAAYMMLHTRDLVNKQNNPQHWAGLTIDAVSATLTSDIALGSPNNVDSAAHIFWRDTNEAISIAEATGDANLLLYGFKTLNKLSVKIGYENKVDTVSSLQKLLREYNQYSDDTYTLLGVYLYLGGCLFDSGQSKNEAALNVYLDGLAVADSDKFPAHCFDLNIRIADIYRRNCDWVSADRYCSEAMRLYEALMRGEHPAGYQLSDIETEDKLLVSAPVIASLAGDPARAIRYVEVMYSGDLTKKLEDLVTIDHQIDRSRLFQDYLASLRSEKAIPLLNSEDGERIKREREAFEDKLSTLKLAMEPLQHRVFLNSIETVLAKSSSWIMIPMMGYEHTRIIVVPPHASIDQLIISDCHAFGYRDFAQLLLDDGQGLFEIVEHFDHLSTQQIFNAIERLSVTIKSMLFEFASDERFRPFSGEIKKMTVVAYGPLSVLPCAMAYDEETNSHLVDHVTLEYVPNLYALYTLQQRLKFFRADPAVAFLHHKDLAFSPIEEALVSRSAQRSHAAHVSSAEFTLESAMSACRSATHWHIATHGEFGWGSQQNTGLNFSSQKRLHLLDDGSTLPVSDASVGIYVAPVNDQYTVRVFSQNNTYTDFGDIPSEFSDLFQLLQGLPSIPEHIEREVVKKIEKQFHDGRPSMDSRLMRALTTDRMLRLVVLASCETGISDFVSYELSPRSLLLGFIESGALGGVAALWRVPDHATALLFGRFYFHHVEQQENPADALRNAQVWLKTLTCGAIDVLLTELLDEYPATGKAVDLLLREISHLSTNAKPFENPYFWAGFLFVGQ